MCLRNVRGSGAKEQASYKAGPQGGKVGQVRGNREKKRQRKREDVRTIESRRRVVSPYKYCSPLGIGFRATTTCGGRECWQLRFRVDMFCTEPIPDAG